MATVFLAQDIKHARPVALKVVDDERLLRNLREGGGVEWRRGGSCHSATHLLFFLRPG